MKKFATAFLSVAAAASLCSAATPRILTADAQRARAIGVCIDGRAVLRTDDAALSKAAPRKAPVKRAAVSADVPEILYDTPEGEITEKYTRMLEQTIRRDPAIWLWTHKRWKRPVNMELLNNERNDNTK